MEGNHLMDASVAKSLLDPAILFFFLGGLIGLVRSNLEIPAPVAKFLSLYLLMALGFKGGQSLAAAGFTADTIKVLAIAIALALAIPGCSFLVLSKRTNKLDAAAIAATYGSVSAVTFITASQFLINRGAESGGYMTVALVVMESPAIVMAVLLASWARNQNRQAASTAVVEPAAEERAMATVSSLGPGRVIVDDPSAEAEAAAERSTGVSMKAVLHEAFTDGAHLLLIGSLVIGTITGTNGEVAMKPFVNDIFKGLLAFFLLEMGLLVSRQLREMRGLDPFLVAFALVAPPVNAMIALLIGRVAGLDLGDLTLLAVLAASGSYIVVPAVVRFAIPEAKPSRYFSMALGITFPFNVVIGIPLYYAVASWLAG
jgi:hypothetical protein